MFGEMQSQRQEKEENDRMLSNAPPWIIFDDKEELGRVFYFSPAAKRVVYEPVPEGAMRFDGMKHKRFVAISNSSVKAARRMRTSKVGR